MPLLRRMILIAASAVLIHHAGLWSVQRRLLFPGSGMNFGGAPRHAGLVELRVQHQEGSTFGYLKPADTSGSGEPAPLVVYAHGNAEIVADWVFETQPYTASGLHFLAVEYRGFGTSEGTPTERHLHADIEALVALAAARADVDGSRVIYHGRSLGGAVLGSLAGRTQPAGLILESAFSSTHSMGRRYLAPRYLVRDPLDVEAALSTGYRGPVLLLHSRVDEVIPFAQFERNRRAARSTRDDAEVEALIHETMGHNDTWLVENPAALVEFARSCAAGSGR